MHRSVRRLELEWEKKDLERVRQVILTERYPELGGYDENYENWRWFKRLPEKRQTSPEFLHRPGRKIMLASPKLDIDEHQEIVNHMRELWGYLLQCRTNYRSEDRGYRIITNVFEGFNELRQYMADEVCDMFDIPEGSSTIYDNAQAEALPRRKKADPAPTQTLDRET